MKRFAKWIWVASMPLWAQAPEGWARREALGAGMPEGAWAGAGLWSAAQRGAPAPLVESLGLGNGLTGHGVYAELGWKGPRFEVAGRLMAYRDDEGRTHAHISQGHLSYRSVGGWRTSLEREPLVWGYGLNGGYLLGEASAPIPKLRLSSPMKALSLFGAPLGSWKGEMFLGELQAGHVMPETAQSPSLKAREMAVAGTPHHPFLSGLRAEAAMGSGIELYINWINLFGGTLNGRRMDEGYGAKDYITAFLGLKDASVEGDFDLQSGASNAFEQPKVRSASNSDVGIRIRFFPLESLLGARDVRAYVSRGSKGEHLSYGPVTHRPGYYIGKDLNSDWRSVKGSNPGAIWNRGYRYTAPTAVVPNDGVGLLVDWGALKLGVEYLDTVNVRDFSAGAYGGDSPLYGHRSFTHSTYLVGFYEDGDPLGSALGGEARYTTIHVEWEPSKRWRLQGWLQSGDRPFRDELADWRLDHPGKTPVRDRFVQLQGVLVYSGAHGLTLRAGGSVQRHSAVSNVQGEHGYGVRGYLEAGWRWGFGAP